MMADKRGGISIFLSYVLGLAWSIVLVYCMVGDLRLSIIALAGALFVTGAIVLVIKRIGGRIYYSRVFALVLIFAVFGLPVIPGFRHLTEIARASRAQSEMRDLAVALESYRNDNKVYPPACDNNGRVVPFNAFGVSAGCVPPVLTTSRVNERAIRFDPFTVKSERGGKYSGLSYRYATNGSSCWIVASVGPDGQAEMRIEDLCDPKNANCDPKKFFSHFGVGTAVVYDPSNGTKSPGDIVRVGPE